jgi:iron(III) transport system substrate-binding protein
LGYGSEYDAFGAHNPKRRRKFPMKSYVSLRLVLRGASVLAALAFFMTVKTGVSEAADPLLATMIKKAAEEGTIVYQGANPGTRLPTSDMLRDMAGLAKKQFGVKIKIKIDNALSFPASTAKALTEIMVGATPSFDLMYQTSVSGSPLYKNDAVERIPWAKIFSHIKSKDLEWKGRAVIADTRFVLPEYNTNIVKPKDVPKTWDDLLDPKWKGKLGVLIYPDPWKLLSQPNAWGEEKTMAFLKKLIKQKPKLGRFPVVAQRVISGETPLASGQHKERVLFSKEQRGAPVDVAIVDPALVWVDVLLVPKGARHPNAAALIAAALLTEEGQKLLLKYHNASSMFRPNTPAARFAAAHKILIPDVDFQLKNGKDLSKKIRAILIKR